MMHPARTTILEPLDRTIRLFLRAPVTGAVTRIVLCLPFWWSGLSKLFDFSGGTAEMAALGLEPAWLFNALTILVQLGGSLLVILNRWTWLGAGALGVFTVLVTVLAHQFWTLEGLERVRELNTFLEHFALVAGFVLVSMIGVIGLRDIFDLRAPKAASQLKEKISPPTTDPRQLGR
jgi:transmembrane protein